MARRRTSPLEDAVEMLSLLFSLIPPWVSIPVAIVGFFLIPALMITQVKSEFLVPVFQLLGWGVGVLWAMAWLAGGFCGWAKRRQQTAFLRQNTDIKWLNGLTWQQFEKQIAEVYRRQGYDVEETGGGGSDGGVDLILTRNGEKTLVQCKQKRTWKVGVKPVRELYGVMAAQGAQHGILITSGLFTGEALRFAEGKPLELIDGARCAQMVRQFQQAVGGTTETLRQAQGDKGGSSAAPSCPVCPVCGSPMVLRRAKRGEHAGKEFWGCSQYPKCRGIVELGQV